MAKHESTKGEHGISLSFPGFPQSSADGRAVVIGIPQSFDLSSEIASANTIRLVTAFAHPSGWEMLAPAISVSKAKTLRLLTGTSFFQTDPKVLREWLKLSKSGKVEARLHHPKNFTFHPKVLVVEGQTTFAIVGSGNLSQGGLHGNIECAVFVESSTLLKELRDWFDAVFFSEAAKPLEETLVSDYTRTWMQHRKVTNDLRKQQQQLEEEYVARTPAFMKHWDDAVSAAKQYLKSSDFQGPYKSRVEAGRRIRQYLRYPAFDFDESGWKGFYSVGSLGYLIPIYRDRLFRKKDGLQEGLRRLVGTEGQVPEVLGEFLSPNGKFRITGLGLNIISKILAVHAPLKWAVYNSPVADALRRFGYVPRRGASPAAKFIAFKEMMETFKSATGLPDAYALDAFFYDEYRKLKN
jgi:HKD family nuclease